MAQPEDWFQLGASPGSTRRLSTSRSRHGRGRGSARFRLRRPGCVGARSSMRSCPGPRRRRGRRGGRDSRRRLCSRTGTAGQGARARAGAQGNGWVPGRTGAGRRRQEGRGRRSREGPGPAAQRLTPPPARPGSGGSSRRGPRAGRGRGKGRRRRRPPGRRGRRRPSGNP